MTTSKPRQESYDVVIIGGAMMGSATAWHLAQSADFNGRVLVLERDPSYAQCSTAHTNSCIRQQFSTELNIRISQYTARFLKHLTQRAADDPELPIIPIRNFGYLYLANSRAFADHLTNAAIIQRRCGAETEILDRDTIADRYPFFALDDILAGSLNRKDEGYWDGASLFDYFRRDARRNGVEYRAANVVDLSVENGRVTAVHLSDGEHISAGYVVNCAGPQAAQIAEMAGISLPVEPRKRFSWVFRTENPLPCEMPLTIDPSGIHVRENGAGTFLVGATPDHDPAVDPTDFQMDHNIWMDRIWPTLATRIPAFEAIRVEQEWAGHYAYNTLDQNAILGPHPDISNFLFQNGFSGHGLQQAPAMGRAIAEWITTGGYQTLDMSPFHFDRILSASPLREAAVI